MDNWKVKYLLSILGYLLVFNISVNAQSDNKKLTSKRIEVSPRVDGNLNDSVWKKTPIATGFVQVTPYNGRVASQKTRVKLVYNDKAIYIAAKIFDTEADSLITRLTSRDNLGISDYFGVYIDPFNDYKTAYGFFVSCTGVQRDVLVDLNGGEDESWDAVWRSEVNLTDSGWVAEFEIPYSALRFPAASAQTWGINFFRSVQRNNERDSWNYINRELQGVINQSGELSGIKDIEPPLRLFFKPYFSTYVEHNSDLDIWGNSIKGGLDIKLGLSKSFTLDMMLVPDFGQVRSDDQLLNLSPFELYFGEQRPFFMEDTELFNRAGLFYSRRIGSKRQDILEDPPNENEILVKNPTNNQLINVTKITGKLDNGLSIGVLNGMTSPTYATYKDTVTDTDSKIRVQAFTNYNIAVLDKTIGDNSFVSLANTNVNRTDDDYVANVTGTQFRFANKKNSFAIQGDAALSQKWVGVDSDAELGHKYNVFAGKVSGNFMYDLTQQVLSDTYDPNDMGFLGNNNEKLTRLFGHYNIYKPKGIMQGMYTDFGLTYSSYYEPREFKNFIWQAWLRFDLIKNSNVVFHSGGRLSEMVDYFEPRVQGRKFMRPLDWVIMANYHSNRTRKFTYFVEANTSLLFWDKNSDVVQHFDGTGNRSIAFRFNPGYQFSDKLVARLFSFYQNTKNDVGFVTQTEDDIIFGARNINTLENVIEIDHSFTSKMSTSFRLRHYWSTVDYNSFYNLEDDGYLTYNGNFNENEDKNYNAFTIDWSLNWFFTPGSELSLLWKNIINTETNEITNGYWNNLEETLNSNQLNVFSLRILYHIDYLNIKNALRKKKNMR